jgi:hypothetical protein
MCIPEAPWTRGSRITAAVKNQLSVYPALENVTVTRSEEQRFRETLGDRIHAVLLERNRIYLFPATGGALAEFGPSLVEQYRRSRFPVSLEIFLLDGGGPRVVGELARDAAATILPELSETPETSDEP